MRQFAEAPVALILLLCTGAVQAEWCLDWSSVVQRYTGQSGHCWATEGECTSYQSSRPSGDFSGGCYPVGETTETSPEPDNSAAVAAAEAQKRAYEAARQQEFDRKNKELLQSLKVDSRPPARNARQQLDCVVRQSGDTRGGDWSDGKECPPEIPAVPEPSAPVAVDEFDAIPTDPAALSQFLTRIGSRIGATRSTLTKTDQEIAAREQDVARELKTQSTANDKPTGESDALKMAREALAKAKAEREKTAAELQRLEHQEQLAKAKMPPAAP